MQRIATVILSLAVLGGCQADEEYCDPVGDFALTMTYYEDDCGLVGSVPIGFEIVDADGLYIVIVPGALRINTFSVEQVLEGNQCGIGLSFTDVGVTTDGVSFERLTGMGLSTDGADVTGSGSVSITFGNGASCRQSTALSGNIQ